MKLRIMFVVLALVILTPFARADSLTTTGTVSVQHVRNFIAVIVSEGRGV